MKADLDNPMVVNPDDMDDETFVKHYNARHADQLAGLAELGAYPLNDHMIGMWRIAHDHFHRWGRVGISHDHREAE